MITILILSKNIMTRNLFYLTFILCFCIGNRAIAQDDVKPLDSQEELLKSDNPKYASNKKLVYDMWREFIEAGHLELADKYFTENYIQHNPNIASGRKSLVEAFSKFSKLKPIISTIKSEVVAIVAEGDLVVISFVRKKIDANDKTNTYTTTWFDMFRIENGKIAEHWDGAEK